MIKKRGFDDSFPLKKPNKDLKKWCLKVVNPILGIDTQYRKKVYSKVPIDVIVPTVDKDFDVLEIVIDSIRRYVCHPIKQIVIIAPQSDAIEHFARKKDCTYFCEEDLVEYSIKDSICYCVNNINRTNWLYQQLLKLSCDRISISDFFLIVDSDTFFNRPIKFIHNRKMIMNHSDEYHKPYYEVFEKILYEKAVSSMSFVAHHMLFSKKYLIELKNLIELLHNKKWINVILEQTDYTNLSGFSEYELYGHYMLIHHRRLIKEEYWFNESIYSFTEIKSVPKYIKTISLHSYNKA